MYLVIILQIYFYLTKNKYKFVGLLQGTYFTDDGEPTDTLIQYEACVAGNIHENNNANNAIDCEIIHKDDSSAVRCLYNKLPRLVQFMTTKGLQSKCLCFEQDDIKSRLDLITYPNCNDDASHCTIQE
jgi:hypothetical protein